MSQRPACSPPTHHAFDIDIYDCPCGHMYGDHEYRYDNRVMQIDRCAGCIVDDQEAAKDKGAVTVITRMRRAGHQQGCQCKPCAGARLVWNGRLDEMERLVSKEKP